MREIAHHEDYVPKENCNGCGSGWNAKIIPNTIFFLSILEACCIHDDRYERGGSEDDRKEFDIEFLSNMLVIINRHKQWFYPHWLARHRAVTYYDVVVRAGAGSFNYTEIY